MTLGGDWLPMHAYALLSGCGLALLGPMASRPWMLPAGAVALAGSLAVAPGFTQIYVYGPMLATPAAVLLVAGASDRSRVLELAPLRFTGRISYAVYLWHVPLLRLSGTTYAGVAALPSVALAGVLAVLSTLLLEEPLRRAWRRRVPSVPTGPSRLSRVAGVIDVVEYDPAWPARFEALRRDYVDAMAAAGVPVVAVEHVGSTSVPGLAAKPIIDCDIVVAECDVPSATDALTRLGFRPLGELGIPLRWAFKEPERLAGTNTYVVVDGSLALRNHLAVRDTLRLDGNLRDEYAAAKRRVGAASADIEEYGRGKNAVVQKILAAAGLTEAERTSINANEVPSPDDVPR